MIFEEIKKDFLQARKDRISDKAAFYSWAIGEIQNNAPTKEYTNEVVLPILKNMHKKLSEIKNHTEASIIGKYLPKMLTEEEIREIFKTVEGGMPEKMAYLKTNHTNMYDGKLASQIAKET
jgi:hypothetical protein